MKKKITLSIFSVCMVLITFFSCTKEVAKLQGPTDAQMFAWCTQSIDRFYYQNDSTNQITPAPAQGGFHGPYKLRFNAKVKNALGGDGRLAAGNVLPDSSVIVKVSYTGSTVTAYSIIFKLNQAWTWAQFDAAGAVWQSVGVSPSQCTGCHDGTGNRDKTLTFTYH